MVESGGIYMKNVKNYYILLLLHALFICAYHYTVTAQEVLSPQDTQTISDFEQKAKEYSKLREEIEQGLPILPKDATAEQIENHKQTFQKSVQTARRNAGNGEIFIPAAADVIRKIILNKYQGQDLVELKKTVFEAETRGVPLKINFPYPESKEKVEMPPALLLSLPELPKQLRYRFVGRSLLLVDRENGLIIDFMTDALPSTGSDVVSQNGSEQKKSTVAVQNSQINDSSLPLTLPRKEGSIRFLAIGDTGRGNKEQNELAKVMMRYHQVFPFEFVIMTGDNIYYQKNAEDMKTKFEDVYRPLIDSGVKFYATLGNHDESNQRFYEYFNMNGQEYFSFSNGGASFYSLNSNYMEKRQIDWIKEKFSGDTAKWQIAFFHHPPYSSGKRHGSSDEIRETVEPLLLNSGVDVVFTGHEHFYERIKPQQGIYYFITGAGGKIRKGDIKKNSPLTVSGFDKDLSFMLVELLDDEMHFQVISRAGLTVDSGVIKRRN